MKLFRPAFAGAFACLVAAGGAHAQLGSSMNVLDGNGAHQSVACLVDASSHLVCGAVTTDTSGNPITPAKDGSVTETHAAAGSNPSKAEGIQGCSSCTPVQISANASGSPAGLISCDKSAYYDASTSGETQLVALVSGKAIYICGYTMIAGGTVSVNLDDYNGSAHTKITPAFQLTAQAGAADHTAFWSGLKVAAGDSLYINASAAVAAQVIVYYTQF